MSDNRVGDWMQTATGRAFWPVDPRANEVHIEDIAHALSNQCRFAGHVRRFYSVAEHSVRVSRIVPSHFALAGLLHDAAEAFLVDLPRPIKRSGAAFAESYQKVESGIAVVIGARFGIDARDFEHNEVKKADNVLLMTEARDLMQSPPIAWKESTIKPLEEHIEAWSPELAHEAFLRRFYELAGAPEEQVTIAVSAAMVKTRLPR